MIASQLKQLVDWAVFGSMDMVTQGGYIVDSITMGVCSCAGAMREMQRYFIDDEEVGWRSDLFAPRISTLYALLRKPKDLVVLQSQNQGEPLFANSLLLDSESVNPNDLRNLIGQRRHILFIGDPEADALLIKSIKSICACNRYYLISKQSALSFLQEYPIFHAKCWEQGRTVTSQVPILAVDTADLKEQQHRTIKLFVHGSHRTDRRVYQQVGIDLGRAAIGEPQEGDVVKYYVGEILARIKDIYEQRLDLASIVVLHGSKIEPSLIVNIFVDVLKEQYGVPEPASRSYLGRSLLKGQTNNEPEEPVKAEDPESPSEVFAKLFVKYQREANPQKVERIFNLVNTLTTNIYSHEGQNYRKVKRTTRQIRELVEGYGSGKSMLEQMGWRQGEEQWENKVEGKYLKVFKTDFDVGFKMYRERK